MFGHKKGHSRSFKVTLKSLNILYSLCKLVARGCPICISSVKSAYLKRTWSKNIWTKFTYFIVWLNHKNQIPLDRVVNGTKLSESKPIQNLWDFWKPIFRKNDKIFKLSQKWTDRNFRAVDLMDEFGQWTRIIFKVNEVRSWRPVSYLSSNGGINYLNRGYVLDINSGSMVEV